MESVLLEVQTKLSAKMKNLRLKENVKHVRNYCKDVLLVNQRLYVNIVLIRAQKL